MGSLDPGDASMRIGIGIFYVFNRRREKGSREGGC